MRIQNFEKPEPQKRVTVVDERVPKEGQSMRTVIYLEVGDAAPASVAELVKQVAQAYTNDDRNTHYILPVRGGKIGPDILFEEEWLNVVRQTCEINQSGEIVLKNGADNVLVKREYV